MVPEDRIGGDCSFCSSVPGGQMAILATMKNSTMKDMKGHEGRLFFWMTATAAGPVAAFGGRCGIVANVNKHGRQRSRVC